MVQVKKLEVVLLPLRFINIVDLRLKGHRGDSTFPKHLAKLLAVIARAAVDASAHTADIVEIGREPYNP